MNITNVLKDILTGFNEIDGVNIDYTVNTNSNFGLYSTGENLSREFITGKKEYENNFILYMFKESETDVQRLQNISVLNSVGAQLRNIRNYNLIEDDEVIGYIDSITCGNGMLFAVPGSIYEGYSYQLQIKVNYIIFPPPVSTPVPPPPSPIPEGTDIYISGKDVYYTDDLENNITLFYIDSEGAIVEKEEATKVIIKVANSDKPSVVYGYYTDNIYKYYTTELSNGRANIITEIPKDIHL